MSPSASAPPSSPSNGTLLQVVCLCAAWCGTCKDYATTFARIEQEYPQCQFRWIDIEDEADLVDDFEVENFPTIVVIRDGSVRFAGTLLPHAETLKRLLQNHCQTLAERAISDEQTQLLGRRILAKW
ncbi:thioredoxin family protein [Curvibacter sp. CHRR-16]|uniref:thioredoxin family protein n=1 Tax=Curvibacter sp. CHRR-16 TaxID=2835872 RepID=UPI001BDA0E63|nr:thioredoxin family protein [Curvibacter sp. CHRR-16]MBT0568941.1 thioredoxin family protein [Curvibacter sp. CHRR-16]